MFPKKPFAFVLVYKALPPDNGLNITQDSLCREALQDPIAFWKKQPTGIHWFARYKSVFDETRAPFYRWFPGGLLNACYEAVDTHVLTGKGEHCAIIYDSPVAGVKQKMSYSQLLAEVCTFAAALVRRGVGRGDRVLIYMPLVPEAAVAMLACARIGAIHVVTFGGFGRGELALRIDHAKPKAVIAASCGIESRRVVPYKAGLEQALQVASHKPEFKVLLQRPQHIYENMGPQDVDWDSFLQEGKTEEGPRAEEAKLPAGGTGQSPRVKPGRSPTAAECSAATAVTREAEPVDSDHPLYILYTSGTTGNPKGIVRDHVGQCVSSLYAGSAVYDIKPGETVLCASDLGWVLGHSIMLYGTLINGATTVFYEGKPTTTPDAGAFWRLVSEYGVSKFFIAPSAVRTIRGEDPTGKFLQGKNLETLKAIYLVGEKTDRATMRWLSDVLRKAEKTAESPYVRYPLLVDHWWQTETGWPVTCIMTGFPLKPANFLHRREGSCGKPCPGWDVRILDDEGEEVEANVSGHIALKMPLPPGALTTLYNDDQRCSPIPHGALFARTPTCSTQELRRYMNRGAPLPRNWLLHVPDPGAKYYVEEGGYCNAITNNLDDGTGTVANLHPWKTRDPSAGFYDTGDSGFVDEDGYLYIEGRTDDVLNVAAHRLSGLAIEEVLGRHPAVAAAAVVAVADSVKGQVPVGIIVPREAIAARRMDEEARVQTKKKKPSAVKGGTHKDGTLKAHVSDVVRTLWAGAQNLLQPVRVREQPPLGVSHEASTTTVDLVGELVKDVRDSIGPVACFKSCVVVSSLPHTRSGKVLRKTMALILEGRDYSVPATIEDASTLVELERAVEEQLGIRKSDRELPVWANGLPNL